MKRLLLALCAFVAVVSASAQTHFQSSNNPDAYFPLAPDERTRVNIVLPGLYGYNVYRADLHNHTIYSDAYVTPSYRVREAWQDGLDVLAITEHLEARLLEKQMVDYMKNYVKEGAEPANIWVTDKPADERGFLTDQNYSIKLAQEEAKKYGITIVPGTEISREPDVAGHYNALFVEDNNTIYDADPRQCLLNAKAQGALIMHNHPFWRRPTIDRIPFAQKVYDEGIIDRVEVMNGTGFAPKAIDWAEEYDLFITSNSDAHYSNYEMYGANGVMRNMTLIFAKDKSLESLKEAIKAHRTIAWSFGIMAGKRQILEDFFKASVEFEVISTAPSGVRTVAIKNNTSLEYILRFKGNPEHLAPFGYLTATVGQSDDLVVTVENMWYSSAAHPQITIEIK